MPIEPGCRRQLHNCLDPDVHDPVIDAPVEYRVLYRQVGEQWLHRWEALD